jgi:hypothetical protein
MSEHGLFLTKKLLPKAREYWFIRLPGASALSRVFVEAVTQKTVSVRDAWYSTTTNHYELKDVKFVERTHE